MFKTETGRAYIVTGGKEGATVKRLLAALDPEGIADPVAELQRAARNMLADEWRRARASIGTLASMINQWRGNPAPNRRGRYTQAVVIGAAPVQAREHLGFSEGDANA